MGERMRRGTGTSAAGDVVSGEAHKGGKEEHGCDSALGLPTKHLKQSRERGKSGRERERKADTREREGRERRRGERTLFVSSPEGSARSFLGVSVSAHARPNT